MTPGDHVGPYTLIDSAGLTELWLARADDGSLVHLEMSPVRGSTTERAPLLQVDFEVAQRLRHPNLARFVYAGIHDDLEVVATEFVEGLRLPLLVDGLRRAERDLSPWAVGYIAHGIAQALAQVHQAPGPDGRVLGSLGRPLLSKSINVTRTGGIKLAALLCHRSLDRTETIATPTGLAEEPVADPAQDVEQGPADRHDLFDLGVICWELLCGRTWPRPPETDTLQRGADAPRPELPASVPEALAEVVQRCLSVERRTTAPAVVDMLAAATAAHAPASADELRRLVGLAATTVGPPLKQSTAQFIDEAPPAPPPTQLSLSDGTSERSPGSQIGGRFEVLGRLGSGGMGDVYRVRDRELDEVVALKMIPANSPEPHSLERLRREVRLARQIASDHVCRIYDIVDLGDGTRGLTMALIEGMTLSEMMKVGLQLDHYRFAQWGADVASGLASAHRLGIIHRDLKPENVMIRHADDRAVILDFGIALRERVRGPSDPRLTQQGIIMGTPLYMSPEQLADHPLDGRSDLYALGLILAELITGEVPRSAQEYPLLLKRRAIDPEPYSLRTVDPNVPAALADVIDRLVMSAPADRPPDAGAVYQRLRSVVAAGPSGAVPTTGTAVLAMRRSISPTAVAATIVAALCVVGVGFGLSLLRERPMPAAPSAALAPDAGAAGADDDGSTTPPDTGAATRSPAKDRPPIPEPEEM